MFHLTITYRNLHKVTQMSRKYRVEQYFTTGWSVVDKDAIKLTKDEAKKILQNLMNEGVNPDLLRAIPD